MGPSEHARLRRRRRSLRAAPGRREPPGARARGLRSLAPPGAPRPPAGPLPPGASRVCGPAAAKVSDSASGTTRWLAARGPLCPGGSRVRLRSERRALRHKASRVLPSPGRAGCSAAASRVPPGPGREGCSARASRVPLAPGAELPRPPTEAAPPGAGQVGCSARALRVPPAPGAALPRRSPSRVSPALGLLTTPPPASRVAQTLAWGLLRHSARRAPRLPGRRSARPRTTEPPRAVVRAPVRQRSEAHMAGRPALPARPLRER